MTRLLVILPLLAGCGDRGPLDLNVQQPACLFFCLTILHVYKETKGSE